MMLSMCEMEIDNLSARACVVTKAPFWTEPRVTSTSMHS